MRLLFSSFLFFSHLQKRKNIEFTVVRRSISDSDLCKRPIDASKKHIYWWQQLAIFLLYYPFKSWHVAISYNVLTYIKKEKIMYINVTQIYVKSNIIFLVLKSIRLLSLSHRDRKLPDARSCVKNKVQICVYVLTQVDR
jgi:aryl carrier-like protein